LCARSDNANSCVSKSSRRGNCSRYSFLKRFRPVPGFALQAEYRPAQQLGGDFFQILGGEDESILIVAGDVSGKGLKAAMLVSVIVGTIRTLVRFNRRPIEILEGINERLCGRLAGQFATCIVLHVAPDGEMTIANAGHLPPYRNGAELDLAGSLPIGITRDAEYRCEVFQLNAGDRLTLVSDGVVEATNENGELFGFERTREISTQSTSEIAEKARQFGQRDDITVLSVRRLPVAACSA
jgi:serine phosphatase RsbU (regulator of sigma subunit)